MPASESKSHACRPFENAQRESNLMIVHHAPFRRSSVLWASLLAVAPLALPSTARGQADTTDPRAHLKAGLYDAGVTSKGLDLVAHRNKPDVFHPNDPGGLTYANSDMAFGGHYLYQGNFSGIEIWNIAIPLAPTLMDADVVLHGAGRRQHPGGHSVRLVGEHRGPPRLRHAGRAGHREQGADARHSHLQRVRS